MLIVYVRWTGDYRAEGARPQPFAQPHLSDEILDMHLVCGTFSQRQERKVNWDIHRKERVTEVGILESWER